MTYQQLAAFPQSIILSFREKIRIEPMWWLNASILLYFVLLPFNAFGFTIPGVGYLLKYTEVALLSVIAVAVYTYRKQAFPIRKAQWLYGFLVLHAIAQFTSLFNVRDLIVAVNQGLSIAISVASYSVVVFALVNVIRSEDFIRRILVLMGIIAAGIAIVMYWYKVSPFRTIEFHPSIVSEAWLGLGVPHYVAYFLVMYGSGVAYLFLHMVKTRGRQVLYGLAVLVWFEALLLTSVKIAHLVELAFLVMVVAVVCGARKKALFLLAAFFIVFAFAFYALPIKNTQLALQYKTKLQLVAVGNQVASAWDAMQKGVAQNVKQVKNRTLAVASRWRPARPVKEVAVVVATPAPPPSSTTIEAPAPVTSAPAPTPPPPLVPPAPPTPAPTVAPAPPPTLDIYSADNRVRRRWTGVQLDDSLKIRQRGIAVGWLMGASAPLTGAGVGQTPQVFDQFTDQVRAKARTLDPASWQNRIFVDEEVPANPADKGVFNIFLNAWAETGLLGLLAVVGILATVFFKGAHTLWRMRKIPGVYPLRILFPLFLALILYHQTIYLWVHPWLWTVIALTYAAADMKYDTNQRMKEQINEYANG